MVVIVMGVSGSGKTTVGRTLANSLGWTFADADDWHPASNRSKMRQGIPLTDGDRHPWLAALRRSIDQWLSTGESVILACSALKQSYRDMLRSDDPRVRVVYLKGSFDVIQHRLTHRPGHFMSVDLLQTQFEALEEPQNAIVVNSDQPIEMIVKHLAQQLP